MTGRVFTKLLLSFLLVLFIGTATLDISLRHIVSHSLHAQLGPAMAEQAMHTLRRDLLLASLIAVAVATLLASMLSRSAAQRMSRIVAFANRIAAGDLSARMQEGHLQDEIADVARALDATASRLERSFKELESSRRELAALLDSMQEGVVAVDAQGLVIWSNAVMQRMLPAAIRARRRLVETVRDPEVMACVEGALRDRELRSGKAVSMVQGRVYEINAAPTPGGGAVAVLHDLTGVERAEKMRRDFIANVSHELRTPLTSISGYVETLMDSENLVSEQAKEFLAIILRNASRMNRLTEDLLALASVESGDYKVKLQAVRASRLVEDAIDSFAGMALDHEIELTVEETTGTAVSADADAIHQVFSNLIENAMKYGRAGKRVNIGARDLEGEVEFFVRDFGAGIPSEHLDRIFERFYRVDKARSRESGGTGLGLAIAKHIVLAHHGTIRVESDLGSGAAFCFTLRSVSLPTSVPANAGSSAALAVQSGSATRFTPS